MTGIEAYKTWAPNGVLWTEWVKPVLFASVKYKGSFQVKTTKINWLDNFQSDTAVIVDLPGVDGVEESLALARLGYRPVPLYNGVCGDSQSSMIVNVRNLAAALFSGAELLAPINISNNAPPVFMLDSRRMSGVSKSPGTYDNRWCVFPQDMPSAGFLINHGITKVIVRSEEETRMGIMRSNLRDDLSHILYRYQKAGIQIELTASDEKPKAFDVPKPSQFKSLFYRFQVTMGLSRNAAGGFGSRIPDTASYGDGGGFSSRGYYGFG